MDLLLQRDPSLAHATLGTLYVDGEIECRTLEDVVREIPGEPVSSWKVPGETAIPAGRYRVQITKSARFGRDMPLLVGVPGFAGIRIHTGNTAADTEGCVLVGTRSYADTVLESRMAFARLFDKIDGALAAGDDVWITVRNG